VRDFSHRAVNPPTEYKQFSRNQLPHGEISRYKAEKRVANLGDFSPKSKSSDSLGIVNGSLNSSFSVKYHKNIKFF
jgi:hypothetical protein